MLRLIRFFSVVCLLTFITLTVSAAEVQPVKYVFLFIGDGMSIPQRMMAEEYMQKTENRGLKINDMPYQSITRTHAAGDQYITDSAAGGTAIACGTKTKNGTLGLAPDGNRLESIAELAKKNGRKVGILTSVTINHATPAAFYAHNNSRSSDYEIGLDMIASGFDYFGGGGIASSDNKDSKEYRGNIYDLAKEAGYTVCRTPETIQALKPGAGKVMSFGASGDLPYAIDGNREGRRLADFTKQAIELLDNPNGFFMMVEGGKIDFGCHDNDAATAIRETIEFDDAVSTAFEFAEKKPGEVLIVVTADHETGALILWSSGTGYQVYFSLLANQKGSRGTLESLTEKFVKEKNEAATFENFKPIITEHCGLVFTKEGKWSPGNLNLTKEEMKALENDFAVSKTAIQENKGGKDRLSRTAVRILNSKSGITWGSGGHSPLPVNTSLWGNQADRIADSIRDNTDIAKQLKMAVGTMP
ncbi:MAG: alkaline phosphatase [Planctomycetaceae bacterium]|jgi:alkaline phosphatase|nr:alkaline phosphatase [Planctomycetaceae bacterium]